MTATGTTRTTTAVPARRTETRTANRTLQQVATLAADDGDGADEFGWSVRMAGDGRTGIVGARLDEDPNGERAGSAYVFARSDGNWQQATKLTAEDGTENSLFGESVAMDGDGSAATIGADLDEDPNGENSDGLGAGSAYVFE